MLTSKHIDANRGFSHATFIETGPGKFTVRAPEQLGVWKVYVYVFDGKGNVGIDQRSFKVVPPVVNGTNLALNKPASTTQGEYNGATFFASNAVDGSSSTRWSSEWADSQWIQVDLGSVQRSTTCSWRGRARTPRRTGSRRRTTA